jgi:hypothetical protein
VIGVGSMWRDSHRYIDRSLEQFERLAKQLDALGEETRFYWVDGGSTDDTVDRLNDFDGDLTFEVRDDGCPYFPSVDRQDRWRHLAWIANGVLEMVEEDVSQFIYVESDLAWDTVTMLGLLRHLDEVTVVSPLNKSVHGFYYDVWGSVGLDGTHFSAGAPFHRSLGCGLTEVQSIAGCTAMHGDVARSTRFAPEDCYVGWNRAMRAQGHRIWCDPALAVHHD